MEKLVYLVYLEKVIRLKLDYLIKLLISVRISGIQCVPDIRNPVERPNFDWVLNPRPADFLYGTTLIDVKFACFIHSHVMVIKYKLLKLLYQ